MEKMKDTIYRQDAIDALDCINGTEEVLRSLPSAQPEQLTDNEKRIFLWAMTRMAREELICLQFDGKFKDGKFNNIFTPNSLF